MCLTWIYGIVFVLLLNKDCCISTILHLASNNELNRGTVHQHHCKCHSIQTSASISHWVSNKELDSQISMIKCLITHICIIKSKCSSYQEQTSFQEQVILSRYDQWGEYTVSKGHCLLGKLVNQALCYTSILYTILYSLNVIQWINTNYFCGYTRTELQHCIPRKAHDNYAENN